MILDVGKLVVDEVLVVGDLVVKVGVVEAGVVKILLVNVVVGKAGVVEVVVVVQGGNEQGVVVFGEAVELQGEDAQGVVDGDTLIGVGVTVLFVCTVVFDVLLHFKVENYLFLM